MNTIIKLLLMSLPAASLFHQLPAGVDQSKQDAAVSILAIKSGRR